MVKSHHRRRQKRIAMLRTPIAIALVAMVALSGCMGSQEDPAAASDDENPQPSASDAGPDPGSSPDPGVIENVPPNATLDASVLNGSAPLEVVFTLDGSDADGDELTWKIDKDGDGYTDEQGGLLPYEVNTTFEEAGLYVVTLMVSDGTDSVNASVEINVTGVPAGARVLYLVGDGSTTVVTDPTTAQADANQPAVTDKVLSSVGNGNDRSTYIVAPSGNPGSVGNYLLPTFIGSEQVTFSGAPVLLYTYINLPCPPNAAQDLFPLHAVLFDGEGNQIGDTASAFAYPGAEVGEVVFTLTPEAGTYAGLIVQYGKSATSGPESPCLPFVTEWGDDDVNARLELAEGDYALPVAA
jgi:PKD repeat protein